MQWKCTLITGSIIIITTIKGTEKNIILCLDINRCIRQHYMKKIVCISVNNKYLLSSATCHRQLPFRKQKRFAEDGCINHWNAYVELIRRWHIADWRGGPLIKQKVSFRHLQHRRSNRSIDIYCPFPIQAPKPIDYASAWAKNIELWKSNWWFWWDPAQRASALSNNFPFLTTNEREYEYEIWLIFFLTVDCWLYCRRI